MTDEPDRIDDVFSEAMDRAPSERDAFVTEACDGDEGLRRRVLAMVAAADRMPDAFLAGRDPEPDPATAALPSTIGPYRVIREIGRGGMGVVFECEQDHPRRRVALKVIPPGFASDQLVRRFRQEAEVLGRLEDPGIARIYDAGTAIVGGVSSPYFVMEHIDGLALDRHAEAHELSNRQRLELVARVCDAVQHAHQRGVIHRDLKPGNVLVRAAVTREGEPTGATRAIDGIGQPIILDFGIARLLESEGAGITLQTGPGAAVGTLEFMSPEQLDGASDGVDTRCDVYALGLILFRLLARRGPFNTAGRSIAEVADAARDEAPRLGRLDPSLRGDVETIVAKSLERDRDRRYDAAGGLADDIRRHLRDEPILAHPPSTIYQLTKFARRNRTLVGGVTATLTALVCGLIAAGVLLVRTESARSEAQLAGDRMRQVAEFQASILEGIEVAGMGRRLMAGYESATMDGEGGQTYGTNLAREVLDEFIAGRAIAELDDGYTDDPIVEAQLRASVAEIYMGLYLYDRAIDQRRIVVELREAELGAGDVLAIEAVYELGIALTLNLQREEGVETLRTAARRFEDVLGSDHRSTLVARALLGSNLLPLGRHAEAEAILTETMETMRRVLDPGDEERLLGESMLATVYAKTRSEDEAVSQFQRALRESTRALGETDSNVLHLRQNFSSVLRKYGRLEEAETQLRIAAESWRRIAGDNHEATIVTGYQYAGVLFELGRTDEAVPILQQSCASGAELYEPDQSHWYSPRMLLLQCLCELGRFEEAADVAASTLTGVRLGLGADHPITGEAEFWLARSLEGLGQTDEAQNGYRRAIGVLRTEPSRGVRFVDAVLRLSDTLVAQGRLTEAEELLVDSAEVLLARPAHGLAPARRVISALVGLLESRHVLDPRAGHDRRADEWRAR